MPDNFYTREFLEKHIAHTLSFYEGRVVDEGGGYFQGFYVDGTNFNPDFQQLVSSSRMVINFMLTGHLFKRSDLLDIGRHGLTYLDNVHWRATEEMFAYTLRDHEPEDMTQQCYAYAFVLAAHAAALKAGVTTDGSSIARLFDLAERRFWLVDKGAYADTVSLDGVMDGYRGQNSNMHMCEAMIYCYEATKETRYLERATTLAETFTQRLAGLANGWIWEHYTENFEVDWEYNKNDRTNIYRPWGFQPGHQIEWSKNLLNIHRYTPNDWMLQRARELFDGAWERSWDAEHGGLVYGFGPDDQWCDSEKYFWVQAEAIATAALLHDATGDAKYMDQYNSLWKYSWQNWVDHVHGGWWGLKITRDNKRVTEEKATPGGKCDYHSMVACMEALRVFS